MDLVPINKIIHEALELAIQTQLRCLVKDIATTLGKEAAPLLKAVTASKKVSYYSYSEPDDDTDMLERRCSHCTLEGQYVRTCGEPVVWSKGSRACLEHTLRPSPHKKDGLPVLYMVDDMLVDKQNGYVYDKTSKLIGRYYGNKIIVFEN